MRKLLLAFANRADLSIIANWIEKNTSVIDLGCGDGELLDYLINKKNVNGIGIDIDKEKMLIALKKGIPVVEYDMNNLFPFLRNNTFDYVILSQTLQQLKKPDKVIDEIMRIGKYAILSFPNFGHYKIRLNLLFSGRMPKSKALPYEWYDTPNIHLLTYLDFKEYCRKKGYRIARTIFISNNKVKKFMLFPNFFSEACVVMIEKNNIIK